MKVPCITLRKETEWVETLEGNWNVLAKLTTEDIFTKSMHTIVDESARKKMPFGDGKASEKIASALAREF